MGKVNWRLAGLVLAVFGFSLWAFDLGQLLKFVRHFVFQTRDLDRAASLFAGNLILFGPETTGGGNLPGPLYYFILAFANIFTVHWQGSFVLMVVTYAAGAAAGWWFLTTRISPFAGIVWLLVFLLSAPLENYIGVFLNVSFQCLFLVATIICICEAFGGGRDRRAQVNALYAALFLCGLTIQLHYSGLALVAAIIILLLAPPKAMGARFSANETANGFMLFLAPLLPYFFWVIAGRLGRTLGQAPILAGDTAEALPSMLKFSEWPPWDRVWHALAFLLNGMPMSFWAMLIMLVLGLILPRPGGEREAPKSPYTYPLLVCLVCGLVPMLYVFISPIGYRYGMTFSIAALFLSAVLLDLWRTPARVFLFLLLGLILGTGVVAVSLLSVGWEEFAAMPKSRHLLTAAILILVSLGLRRYILCFRGALAALVLTAALALVQNPSLWAGELANHGMALPRVFQWKQVGRRICEMTGWSPIEIFERLYFLGGHMEMEPRPALVTSGRECVPDEKRADVSGFFVTYFTYFEDSDFKTWLLTLPIPESMRAGLQDGRIELGAEEVFGNVMMIPYKIKNQEGLPSAFHNIGTGYVPSSYQIYLKKYTRLTGVTPLPEGMGHLFTWNECPGRHWYCIAGVKVVVDREKDKTWVEVAILGDSLSQNSPWITPGWTVAWIEPYLEIYCGRRRMTHVLAESVGYLDKYGFPAQYYSFFLGNHSILAPIRRTFKVDCRVTEVAVGRKSAVVSKIHSTETLPPRHRSAKM
jgi:hypothetical protein